MSGISLRDDFRSHRPLTGLEIVQNPALGAYAIWQFGLGYQAEDQSPVPIPLAFLVLPLLLHRTTLDLIISTQKRSGLTLFAAKLGEDREDLLAVHNRALVLRTLTLRSIGFAVNAGLATITYSNATLRANTPTQKMRKPFIPERIKGFSGAAEKVGCWFKLMNLTQISSTLRVDF
ncbi:three component ABC system middle component [Acidisoma cladoniae]|uniref:three component ABC system middle component n=1 Tax=Acidisoma cladoniae TaxID=3040935 RepID=UPI0033131EC6